MELISLIALVFFGGMFLFIAAAIVAIGSSASSDKRKAEVSDGKAAAATLVTLGVVPGTVGAIAATSVVLAKSKKQTKSEEPECDDCQCKK